ncbi:MAG: transcription antitermination factor NusB [Oceanospirillales bacterium]|uniref:Transcription antitermination protein NusB n=1 Tax=Marinobacterium halophilum TaxID=267374 RepID=A0A2P8EXG4_9GAMM|nr:transcription antitermination factor NusB [Marinobacterium halophilum]MBR9827203.1 transcription antitermination factor NusB [Oceanospirillales bacterium]PSL14154.1 NusB antitermination factor [Marinobacterium halophilum]
MNDTTPRKKGKPSLTEMRRNARSFALQALYQWSVAGQLVNEIEAQFRVDNDMSATDIKLFCELLRGVTSGSKTLDEAYRPFLDRPLADLDPVELSVLRIGAYELIHRLQVPYRVAINESVELAKVFGATESHKYVNGILDKLAQRVRGEEIRARRSGN